MSYRRDSEFRNSRQDRRLKQQEVQIVTATSVANTDNSLSQALLHLPSDVNKVNSKIRKVEKSLQQQIDDVRQLSVSW